MICLSLIPLLLAAMVALGVILFALQRSSLAQAICVQSMSELSEGLGRDLTALMRLNPRARRLKRQLRAAERARDVAHRTLHPAAIAAAEAVVAAIRLARLRLDAEQRVILARAGLTRSRGQIEARQRAIRLGARRAGTRAHSPAPLAVQPRTVGEVAPEYVELPDFERRQRQDFLFEVGLTPDFAPAGLKHLTRGVRCATTIRRKETRWRNQIVEASARSNSP